jgi:hypothetical protein
LEKFRRYITEASTYDTEESLLQSIKGEFRGNPKTKFGGAYHKIIEGDFKDISGQLLVEEKSEYFIFTEKQARPALDYRREHPLMVHEMNVSKVYDTAFFPIQVNGRVDGIEGSHVRDAKTRFKSNDVRDYMDSSQWKFYLDMLGVDIFWYDVFEVKGFDGLPPKPPYKVDAYIIPHEPIKCIRYDLMVPEIESLLNGFLDYVHVRNLLPFLKPAIIKEELNF